MKKNKAMIEELTDIMPGRVRGIEKGGDNSMRTYIFNEGDISYCAVKHGITGNKLWSIRDGRSTNGMIEQGGEY